MAYKAKDGTPFTNRSGMVRHDSKSAAKAPAPKEAPAMESAPTPEAGPDITQDPEAMQAIDLLVQKGYSGEQIEEAVEQLQGAGEQPAQEAPAAPMSSGMMG